MFSWKENWKPYIPFSANIFDWKPYTFHLVQVYLAANLTFHLLPIRLAGNLTSPANTFGRKLYIPSPVNTFGKKPYLYVKLLRAHVKSITCAGKKFSKWKERKYICILIFIATLIGPRRVKNKKSGDMEGGK